MLFEQISISEAHEKLTIAFYNHAEDFLNPEKLADKIYSLGRLMSECDRTKFYTGMLRDMDQEIVDYVKVVIDEKHALERKASLN